MWYLPLFATSLSHMPRQPGAIRPEGRAAKPRYLTFSEGGSQPAAWTVQQSRLVCTNCGSIFDADVNAAKNILKLGISPTGGLPGMACESSQTTGGKQEEEPPQGPNSGLHGREKAQHHIL